MDIAFGTRIIGYRIYNNQPSNLDYSTFLNSDHVYTNLKQILSSYLHIHSALKFQILLYGEYVKKSDDPEEDYMEKRVTFQTCMTELLQNQNPEEQLQSMYDQLLGQSEEFTIQGSGWALKKILYLEIHISKYSPLKGGVYIDLPKAVKNKEACYNPKNNDNDCFKWAVRGFLRWRELLIEIAYGIRELDSVRRYITREITEINDATASRIDAQYELDWSCCTSVPVTFDQINDFLDINATFSVSIYGIDADDEKTIVGPLYRSSAIKENHIHLLMIEKGGHNHFALIKDLSRLVHSQLGGRRTHKEICEMCLQTFLTYAQLVEHQSEDCLHIVTYLPDAGTKMEFKNHQNSILQPIVVYADFESVLRPVQSCENEPGRSNSSKKTLHVASSYGYLVKYAHDSSKDYLEVYRQEEDGENCTKRFVNSLYTKLKSMYEDLVLNNVHPMIFTRADRTLFNQQSHCHICKKRIIGKKVRDHCHRTGKFRGAACDACNKKFYLTKEVISNL